MKKNILIVLFGLGALLLLFGYYYFALPIMNFKSPSLYFPLIILFAVVFGGIAVLLRKSILTKISSKGKTYSKTVMKGKEVKKRLVSAEEKFTESKLFLYGASLGVVLVCVVCIVASVAGSKLCRSKSYFKQLAVQEGNIEEFNESFDLLTDDVKLPLIDKDLSFKLAQARLSNYGAQYSIDSENFTILSVAGQLYRVTPLEYSGLFVSLSKASQGSSGYIKVNVETTESELVLVDGGIKYLPSGKFKYDLVRHIRLSYPTTLFNDYYFEIDDTGKPYWVIPTYTNEFSLFGGENSTGIILCNPVTGETNKYAIGEEPQWVDRVVNDKLAESQATNSLKYKNGYFNAHFGQKKEVFQASDGYNYFIKDNHTYYVSCMTSPNEGDQTSIGFITVDLKTKQAMKYYIDGITEMRCRSIAMLDESVKAQQLDSTWPILVSYNKVPTYFVVLKNEVQYQKLCLINVSDGSIVAMDNTLSAVTSKYQALLANKNPDIGETKQLSGEVTAIRDLGDSIEFMISAITDKYFVVNVDISLTARFMKVGDQITISYKEYTDYNYVVELS